ncbi:heterokaryon incompatibility protein-domain-containing protein [Jackrogersella minutella]|nr:heterokaryon incompatibility protein-domain-containing protein [Jackrogersella minutella]
MSCLELHTEAQLTEIDQLSGLCVMYTNHRNYTIHHCRLRATGLLILEDFGANLEGYLPSTLCDSVLKSWIHYGDTQHKRSHIHLNEKTRSTERYKIHLIDVEQRRIVSVFHQEHEYVALSYVWGTDTAPLRTEDTFTKFSLLNGLPDDSQMIPRIILDAMRLVRDLDLRYLWVDSLSILQDNDADKFQHLPMMDRIYNDANLVVVAVAGENAHTGISRMVQSGNTRQAQQYSEVVNGVYFTTVLPMLYQVLERTKWKTRGRTFHKTILARRVIFFTEHQVYWNCRESF